MIARKTSLKRSKSTLKRKPFSASNAIGVPKKKIEKKQTDADLFREWGLVEDYFRKKNLRYKNPIEKGIYWIYFARYIRERDLEKWGRCISCDKPLSYEDSQAGHFMPAGNCGRDLLFDELNVNAECGGCNAYDEAHLLGYADNLDKRYGQGTAMSLRKRREEYKNGPPLKEFKGHEYAQMIKKLPTYQQRMRDLGKDVVL